jgi:hypothetical protein
LLIEARRCSGLPEVLKNALDDICDPPGSLAGRTGEQLHVGWIHPPVAGSGCCGSDSSVNFRQTARRLGRPQLSQTGFLSTILRYLIVLY